MLLWDVEGALRKIVTPRVDEHLPKEKRQTFGLLFHPTNQNHLFVFHNQKRSDLSDLLDWSLPYVVVQEVTSDGRREFYWTKTISKPSLSKTCEHLGGVLTTNLATVMAMDTDGLCMIVWRLEQDLLNVIFQPLHPRAAFAPFS